MPDSIMYHEGNRRLQDQFDSRRISDRLEEKLTRTAFTADDKAFIESAIYFFIATADADGRPDCSFKGGAPGFVRVTAPDELAFPDYDGNGMFKSLGNLLVNPNVGLLFLDMHEKPRRLRVNGQATVSREDPLLARHGRGAADRARQGARHLPQLPALHPQAAAGRALPVRAPARQGPGRAGMEGLCRLQGLRASAPADGQGRERQRLRRMDTRRITVPVFAATMALAGFLLFQVQPLLGKYILPWFGGSASTWIVCLLFFQAALLAGYAHAYAITLPLSVPRQAQVQIAILVGSLLLLPITPSEGWKPRDVDNPTWRILALLALTVGVPYIVLATTTPLLSRWLARIEPGLDPARFYAASNLGAFAGLISYPFVFERAMSSGQQTRWWSWAYVLYAAAVCRLRLSGAAPGKGRQVRRCAHARPSARQRRSPGYVGGTCSAGLDPAAGDDQCDLAMVGRPAVPLDPAAQPLSPDLRLGLRLSALVCPNPIRRCVPAAGRRDILRGRAGIRGRSAAPAPAAMRQRCSWAARSVMRNWSNCSRPLPACRSSTWRSPRAARSAACWWC